MEQGGTFGSRVLDFYESLQTFAWADDNHAVMSPVADERRKEALTAFCQKFYSDNEKRVYCLGINPSRIRATSTGVPYTDGWALTNVCGIKNDFDQSRELTATFFNDVITEFGGPSTFYKSFYAGALYPLSILTKKKYANYYDRTVPEDVRTTIPQILQKQCNIGSNRKLIIIGSGENSKKIQKLNDDLGLFDWIKIVEHPRYIMQYKRDQLRNYTDKYIKTLADALNG